MIRLRAIAVLALAGLCWPGAAMAQTAAPAPTGVAPRAQAIPEDSLNLFQNTCREMTDYDALHARVTANGWAYRGANLTPSAQMALAATSGAQVKWPEKMETVAPVITGLMAAMLIDPNEHSRSYSRQTGGDNLILRLNFYPARPGERGPQVSCTLMAIGEGGLPDNAALNAAIGGKPDSKQNAKRVAGKPVMLIWDGNPYRTLAAWAPASKSDAAQPRPATASYARAVSTTIVPTQGDPPGPGQPEPAPTSSS